MAVLYILGDLGGSNTLTASYSLAFFGLGNALTIPIGAYLGERYGQRQAVKFWMRGFILCTLLVAISPTYPFFILSRFFQGVFSGAVMLIVSTILTDLSCTK